MAGRPTECCKVDTASTYRNSLSIYRLEKYEAERSHEKEKGCEKAESTVRNLTPKSENVSMLSK